VRFLVAFAVKRPVAITMITVTLALLGVLAAAMLPVDFLPELDIPELTVVTRFEGLPSTEVRELITIPLEDTLSSSEGLKNIRSVSTDGLSIIDLEFHWGTDMAVAGAQTRELIDIGFLSLPNEAERPIVLPVDPSETPVLMLGLFPQADVPLSTVRQLAEREIRTAVQQVRGVGSVQLVGGRREEIHVDVDQEMMSARNLSVQNLAALLSANNLEYPAGSIEEGDLEYIVKADGRATSLQAISDLYVSSKGALPSRLGDLARVYRGFEKRYSLVFHNGEEGVALLVRRQAGYSPVRLADNLREVLPELDLSFGRDVGIRFLLDESVQIRDSVRNLTLSALMGAGMAFGVILLFLRKITSSIILLCSIPASILSTLATFHLLGISLNIMSLGGLAIGIGMLVDNSVVVLENLQTKAGQKTAGALIAATEEVASAVLGSTLTTLTVFVPLFFLPGLLGDIFGDLAAAVCLSLGFSLLFAVTLVPVLYRHFGGGDRWADQGKRSPGLRSLLRLLFRHPAFYALFVAALLAGAYLSLKTIESSWLQAPVPDRAVLTVRFSPGTGMDYVHSFAGGLHRYLSAFPWTGDTVIHAGGDPQDPYSVATSDGSRESLVVEIRLTDSFRDQPIGRIRADLQDLTDDPSIEWDIRRVDNPLLDVLNIREETRTFELRGSSREYLESALRELRREQGKHDMTVYPEGEKPHVHIVPDREALSSYELTLAALSRFSSGAIHGTVAGVYREAGRNVPIVVRLAETDRDNVADLGRLVVLLDNGKRINLSDVVEIQQTRIPSLLYRSGRQDAVRIQVPREQAELVSVLAGRPEVTDIDEETWASQLRPILMLIALAAFLLYALLGAQFESFLLPLVFMLLVPVAVSGSVGALRLFGYPLSLNALLSFLVVLGLSVNNAIVLFVHFRARLPQEGNPLFSIYRGTESRLRPVLITYLTTVLALLPVAMNLTGDNGQSAIALSIIGGLSTTTAVSICIYPWVFYRYFRASWRRRAR
jgi:HAE1 family hydrophobic/amphiphilic exporter-1